jgi:hypothetical protein
MTCIRRNNIPNCGCCVPARDDPGHGEGHAARFERNSKDMHDDCERTHGVAGRRDAWPTRRPRCAMLPADTLSFENLERAVRRDPVLRP